MFQEFTNSVAKRLAHTDGKGRLIREFPEEIGVSECRNCGRNDLHNLGHIGKVFPFFLKRVLGMELRVPRSPHALKQKVRDLVALPMGIFSRVTAQFAYAEMQLCEHCSFIQTTIPFHDDDIKRLYLDYRSASYNRQRIGYEPEYAAIAAAVGQDQAEVQVRTAALGQFLSKNLQLSGMPTILDYGGADGRFIPEISGSKFVYEISGMEPLPGITRIKSESELKTYSLVLLAHVTEHLTNPLHLVRKLSAYVEPGGYLYIETPQDVTDQQIKELQEGIARFDLAIHEHINYYCISAVTNLLEAAGFSIVAVERSSVDVRWAKAVHLRALGRKQRNR
jgi:hypothetical protein